MFVDKHTHTLDIYTSERRDISDNPTNTKVDGARFFPTTPQLVNLTKLWVMLRSSLLHILKHDVPSGGPHSQVAFNFLGRYMNDWTNADFTATGPYTSLPNLQELWVFIYSMLKWAVLLCWTLQGSLLEMGSLDGIYREICRFKGFTTVAGKPMTGLGKLLKLWVAWPVSLQIKVTSQWSCIRVLICATKPQVLSNLAICRIK